MRRLRMSYYKLEGTFRCYKATTNSTSKITTPSLHQHTHKLPHPLPWGWSRQVCSGVRINSARSQKWLAWKQQVSLRSAGLLEASALKFWPLFASPRIWNQKHQCSVNAGFKGMHASKSSVVNITRPAGTSAYPGADPLSLFPNVQLHAPNLSCGTSHTEPPRPPTSPISLAINSQAEIPCLCHTCCFQSGTLFFFPFDSYCHSDPTLVPPPPWSLPWCLHGGHTTSSDFGFLFFVFVFTTFYLLVWPMSF